MEKKDKRTESLTAEEVLLLKELSKKAKSFTDFAIRLKLERVVLINTIMRGSGAPETIKKIRKFLSRQTQNRLVHADVS